MKIRFLNLLLIVVLFSCKNETESKHNETVTFSDFLQEYQNDRLAFYPIEGTYAGITKSNSLLPNTLTQKYREDLKSMYTKYKDGLKNYDISRLSEEEKMSYDILNWECDINLTEKAIPDYLMPINQFESMHLTMGTFASGEGSQPFKTAEDYDNWLKRLDAYCTWLDTAQVNMKIGIEKGYVIPSALTKKMIPQFEDMTSDDITNHMYFSPIKLLPATINDADKVRLTAAFTAMIHDKLVPRFKSMTKFLKEEYLPACRSSSGISALTNGAAYYQQKIKEQTTTNMTAEEVHALGLSEVARLRSEMEVVMKAVDYKGDLKSFFNFVRNKKELMPFTEPQQVIDNFKSIHEKMKPNLAKLFDVEPKTKFEIRRTEAFREASASAEYIQGSVDGTRPGVFYVPIPNVKTYNLYSDEDLFLHEAIPGHHYQISLQQENNSLPEFRKTLWYGAYGEGWALYSESLGKELGLYSDPYQYFGMLSAEMHRAIRLVVDTGMHAKGWSREKAIQYSLDNEAESESSIVSEVERYMSWPGQALSYKIGQLKIKELRKKLEQKEGDKFDIRKFHHSVLESGCLPLAVLEEKIMR